MFLVCVMKKFTQFYHYIVFILLFLFDFTCILCDQQICNVVYFVFQLRNGNSDALYSSLTSVLIGDLIRVSLLNVSWAFLLICSHFSKTHFWLVLIPFSDLDLSTQKLESSNLVKKKTTKQF